MVALLEIEITSWETSQRPIVVSTGAEKQIALAARLDGVVSALKLAAVILEIYIYILILRQTSYNEGF